MEKIKYTILIPLHYYDGSRIPDSEIDLINDEFYVLGDGYNSCVKLDPSKKDPVFQQMQTYINWNFSQVDIDTYTKNCSLFSEATRQGIKAADWDTITKQWVVNGHHLGTTRMSASDKEKEGVVDQNLKVHGVENLYVAGSSVFPTAGVANPTMTIVALSIRLGEHLRK